MHAAQDINITPGHVLCIIERVVVLIWRQTPTRAGIDAARAMFHLIHARRPTEKWGFLTVFEPAATISNVPDEVLALLGANGGVVMVNWVPSFLSDAVWQWSAGQSAEEARLKAIHREDSAAVKAGLKAWEAAHPRPAVTVANVADHIEHVAKIAGHDHVGIGADLDGIPFTPEGLTGVQSYPLVFAELIRRGWSDADLAKLAGGNVLRVLRQAEQVAASLRTEPAAMSDVDTGK